MLAGEAKAEGTAALPLINWGEMQSTVCCGAIQIDWHLHSEVHGLTAGTLSAAAVLAAIAAAAGEGCRSPQPNSHLPQAAAAAADITYIQLSLSSCCM
jgi:hypothetical protein